MKIFRAFFLTLLFGAGSGWTENIRAVTLLIIEVWFGEGFKGDGTTESLEKVWRSQSASPPLFFVCGMYYIQPFGFPLLLSPISTETHICLAFQYLGTQAMIIVGTKRTGAVRYGIYRPFSDII